MKLEQYLKQLVKIFVIPPLELLNFLNYQLYVCVNFNVLFEDIVFL